MRSPIRKHPVTFTASVPHGKRAPMRADTTLATRYRASAPTPPPTKIHAYFIRPRRSRGLQTFGDFLLVDGTCLDQLPIGFGDIDRGGAGAGTDAAIEHQV